MKIARVFPTKTSMSPTDPLAFFGPPTMLCGYPEDSMDAAEKRAKQIMGLGFLPFAMLYRDEEGKRDPEWRKFQREWANAVIVGRKFGDYWKK